jgi:hypothetical protein
MKKMLIAIAIVGLMGAVVWAVSNGFGKTLSVTSASQQVTGFTANLVSVYNDKGSASVVYALVNCETGTLDTAVASNTAVCIPPGMAFTFDTRQKGLIDRICFESASGTNTVYMGAY